MKHKGTEVEERRCAKQLVLWDLVNHIYSQQSLGQVIILTDKPLELLSTTRKQWFRLLRQVQRDRSSTLNSARIRELSGRIGWMERLLFSHKNATADILFLTINECRRLQPEGKTMYLVHFAGNATQVVDVVGQCSKIIAYV